MSDIDFKNYVFDRLVSKAEREHVELMFSNYSAATEGLSGENPHIRLAAVEILRNHWNLPVEQLRSIFVRLFDDNFELIRCMAYDFWSATYRCTENKAACSDLANIALDESKSNHERRTAYYGIERILGISIFLKPVDERQDEHQREMLVEKKIDEAKNDRLPEMDVELLQSLRKNPQ